MREDGHFTNGPDTVGYKKGRSLPLCEEIANRYYENRMWALRNEIARLLIVLGFFVGIFFGSIDKHNTDRWAPFRQSERNLYDKTLNAAR